MSPCQHSSLMNRGLAAFRAECLRLPAKRSDNSLQGYALQGRRGQLRKWEE